MAVITEKRIRLVEPSYRIIVGTAIDDICASTGTNNIVTGTSLDVISTV